MSNGYMLEIDGIVGEDCAYIIRENLEEQLGELDSFTCLSTQDGEEPGRYKCTFTMASSASLEAITQCTFYPYKLMYIMDTDPAIPLLRALIPLLAKLNQEKNMSPAEIRQIPSLLTKVEQHVQSTPFFNTKKKENTIKVTTQKERFTPPPAMGMIVDITEEEMAASAFGQGSHTAKKYSNRMTR